MTENQRINWYKYCSEPLELVENYQQAKADNFAGWCIHHRLEIQQDGTLMSRQELKDKDLYFNRPANELVFMRRPEHKRLHLIGNTCMKGKHHSEETRLKMSEAHKGKHHSEETRLKMSESAKSKYRSTEARQKLSESLKGKHRSVEARKKMSEAKIGKHWYNNGVTSILAKTCPEGFVPGRLK